MSRKCYANVLEEMKKTSSNERDFNQANLWKKARVNKNGEYKNKDVQEVVNRIDEISKNYDPLCNKHPNDILTQALGTQESGGRVRGVGGFVTPTIFWHTVKQSAKHLKDQNKEIISENEALCQRVEELEAHIQKTSSAPISGHGSGSKPTSPSEIKSQEKLEDKMEMKDIKCQKKLKKKIGVKEMKVSVSCNVLDLEEVKSGCKKKQIEKEKASMKMAKEKDVGESKSVLPISLKPILRFAEKVMTKGSSISFQLPIELFGFNRNSCVLREDIIDFCNMEQVKTLTLVAYMAYLHSSFVDSKEVSQFTFVDPSLISFGHNSQEVRTRNLCSRLMASEQNQICLAPFNPGGHWALLAINAYDDTVYYLDSMRTTSRVDIRHVADTAIAMFRSQKNIQKTRKQTLWRTVKCPLQVGSTECGYYVMRYMRDIVTKKSIAISDSIDTRNSYSQMELDEVRVELAEFLSCYI